MVFMDVSRSTCDVKAIWSAITRASAKLSSTHHENHNITLNVRLRGRRALYNHQSRGRPRAINFSKRLCYIKLFSASSSSSCHFRFAKVNKKLGELTLGVAASCLSWCSHHHLLVAWYYYDLVIAFMVKVGARLHAWGEWLWKSEKVLAHGG